MGTQITRLALPFQVYTLTGSTLAIAALTVFQLVPILVFALGAGSLVDVSDRRRVLFVTQVGLMLFCSLALVLLAAMGDPPLGATLRGGLCGCRSVRRGSAGASLEHPGASSA